MAFIDNILNRFGFISEKEFTAKVTEAIKSELDMKLPLWLGETADASKWIMPSPSIFATQADMYRLSPILGTAVNILGNDIGTSKLNIMRMVGEEVRDITNHPFELLLRNPNPADSGIELLQQTVSSYLLNGNAIWWLNRKDENSIPDEIWGIPFSTITPIPDKYLYVSHYEYYPGNIKTPMRLETNEIVHFKTYNPDNRFVGLSPLESLAMTLRGDLAMRKTNTVMYAEYGGSPQSILSFKEFVQEPAWSNVKNEVREAAKRNEMMMLRGVGDGVSWLQRSLSSKDADFLNGLKQNMTDVFNRMCPGLLNMLSEGATYSNASAAQSTYAAMTKWPIMEVVAQKITSDILPAYGRKLIAQFEDPRYVDIAITLQERAADEKIMTVEELRREYKQLDPLGDERDDLLLSQVTATTGQPVPEPAAPIVPPADTTQPMNEPSMDALNNQVADVPQETPMKAELLKWKRYSIRTFGKATFRKFESATLPDAVMREVRVRLGACKSVLDVADVFEGAMSKDVMAVSGNDAIKALADAINKAVDATR